MPIVQGHSVGGDQGEGVMNGGTVSMHPTAKGAIAPTTPLWIRL